MWVITERRDAAFEGSSEVDNPLQERTSIAVLLVAADLRLTDRFGVQAAVSVPDITRTAIVPRPAGPLNYRETFSGLGDTSLVAWSRLNPVHRWNLVVNFGASLPTGRTERPRFRPELQVEAKIPAYRRLANRQLDSPVIFQFGISRAF